MRYRLNIVFILVIRAEESALKIELNSLYSNHRSATFHVSTIYMYVDLFLRMIFIQIYFVQSDRSRKKRKTNETLLQRKSKETMCYVYLHFLETFSSLSFFRMIEPFHLDDHLSTPRLPEALNTTNIRQVWPPGGDKHGAVPYLLTNISVTYSEYHERKQNIISPLPLLKLTEN